MSGTQDLASGSLEDSRWFPPKTSGLSLVLFFCLGEKHGLSLWQYAQDEVLGSVTCMASFMGSR